MVLQPATLLKDEETLPGDGRFAKAEELELPLTLEGSLLSSTLTVRVETDGKYSEEMLELEDGLNNYFCKRFYLKAENPLLAKLLESKKPVTIAASSRRLP